MGSFCRNCGNALGDMDKVCGRCGTFVSVQPQMPQGVQYQPSQQPAMQYQQCQQPVAQYQQSGVQYQQAVAQNSTKSGKKKLSKGAIIGIVASAVAVVVVVALVVVFGVIGIGGKNGYERAIDDTMKLVEDGDADSIMDNLPDMLVDYAKDEFGSEKKASKYVDEKLNNYLDNIKSDVGKINSLSYEIVDEYEIDSTTLTMAKLAAEMSGEDIDLDDVDGVIFVEMEITADGKKDEETYDKQLMVCIDQDGWTAFPYFISGEKMGTDDIKSEIKSLKRKYGDIDFD